MNGFGVFPGEVLTKIEGECNWILLDAFLSLGIAP